MDEWTTGETVSHRVHRENLMRTKNTEK
jgi:hypothetical protein